MNTRKISNFGFHLLLLYSVSSIAAGCSVSQSQSVNGNSSEVQATKTPTSLDTKKAIEVIEQVMPVMSPTASPLSDEPFDERGFKASKLDLKSLKKQTLDKQPEQIISKLREDHDNVTRKPENVNVFVQERDFNQDGKKERILYYKQYSDSGVPRLLVFQNINGDWSKYILDLEGSPDSDIPQIEFLTKPDSKEFDVIKTISEVGDWIEVTILQIEEGEYRIVQCQKIVNQRKEIVNCN